MLTQIDLDFQIGHHAPGLGLAISTDEHLVYQSHSLMIDQLSICLQVQLPCKILFDVSGRHEHDTVIDHQGCILKDKFVNFSKLSLDGFPIETWKIPSSHLHFSGDPAVSNKNFWSRNGQAQLILDESDPLLWVLNHPTVLGVA
jgi:hypothetical protein